MLPVMLPVALNLENRAVLIIGGGAVAARKEAAFGECGARVTVVSPELSAEFSAVQHRAKRYESADLEGFFLVCACTNDRAVNAQIAADARAKNLPCNLADDPKNSDFHTVATVRRGEITVGVSTHGVSPVLARFVRQKIEEALPPELETLMKMASNDEIPREMRGEFWRQVLQSDVLQLLRDGKHDEAETAMLRFLRGKAPNHPTT